jgi:hypothetical protein
MNDWHFTIQIGKKILVAKRLAYPSLIMPIMTPFTHHVAQQNKHIHNTKFYKLTPTKMNH